ncbi:transcriptional regulatory protein [Planotetraspora thailandica]|uniref:Transcriptional regulatory protein n=1 Tax=Planotetraspora thailandica TaxID=487172 RepID=A0A8J3XSF1_9ACTN|nr:response regulator [Planotetraspora thailandica]GII53152.1 transcriptional regulatory protein [Planotetraspora thailandica]
MIRVLVVDDDFRVADLHARYVGRVPGFEVGGVAHTAAEAVELAARLRPHLVLLDQYLPDASGTSIVPRLGGHVIMLTAAAESAVVREALGHGVVNYLVKPFSESDLAERLRAYARFHARLDGPRPGGGPSLSQAEIDRAMRTLREGDRVDASVRKGRSSHTAQLVIDAVRGAGEPVTAVDVATRLGLSRATAQRYLSDLAADGRVTVGLRYGTTGRPEHLYRWPTQA